MGRASGWRLGVAVVVAVLLSGILGWDRHQGSWASSSVISPISPVSPVPVFTWLPCVLAGEFGGLH